MAQLILAFVAGALTVAAPCILPMLPIIVGGSLLQTDEQQSGRQWRKPLVITASLALSVIIFSLLLKATTSLLGVSQHVWQFTSGGIIILLGLNYIWPHTWERLNARFYSTSSERLGKAARRSGTGGQVLMGAALGPVFNSCSPTYALIVATVLPASFAEGLVYLAAYAFGLSAALLLIAYFGQSLVTKLRWVNAPAFKRGLAALFIIVGLAIIFGLDKKFQTFVLERGYYDPISNLEKDLSR